MKVKVPYIVILLLFFFGCKFFERPDKKYSYTIANPVYPAKNGPAIYIDEAHHNAHTLNTGYKPFADVLQNDGYNLFAFNESFTKAALENVDILVIINALNIKNIKNPSLPTYSAFSPEEIVVIKNWVENGGSLFLVADHMPYPGAASELAYQFGFILTNSFAMRSKYNAKLTFTKKDKTLVCYEPITNGIDSIVSYFGSAFQAPKEAHNLLLLPKDFTIYLTEKPWRFPKRIRVIPAENYSQAAVAEYGKGKLAIVGEGAMFTAQYMTFNKSGINSPKAPYNVKFLLNIIHWLDKNNFQL